MTSRRDKMSPAKSKTLVASTSIPVLSGAGEVIAQSRGKPAILNLNVSKKEALELFGGSDSNSFNATMLGEVLTSMAMANTNSDPNVLAMAVQAAGAALKAFKPTDAIEGMLATQAVALHFGAMECLRRAMISDQPFEIATRFRKDAANMMRAMTEMLDALDRKRGKGPQVVRVERVVVHEGGQAIVGNVTPGGRAEGQKAEGERHAQNLRG